MKKVKTVMIIKGRRRADDQVLVDTGQASANRYMRSKLPRITGKPQQIPR